MNYKKLISFIVLTLIASFVTIRAQSPEFFNYQSVVRDGDGNPITNQTIGLQLKIHESNSNGTVIFSETHTVSTNEFGLLNVLIGNGNQETGSISDIEWGSNSYFLEVLMDHDGGTNYQSMGTSQLVSVPYAMQAERASNVFSGNYDDLNGKPDTTDWDLNEHDDFSGSYDDLTNKPDTSNWDLDETDDFSLPFYYNDSLTNDLFGINAYGDTYADVFRIRSYDTLYGGDLIYLYNRGQYSNSIDIVHEGDNPAVQIDNEGSSDALSIEQHHDYGSAIDIYKITGYDPAIDIYHNSDGGDAIEINQAGTDGYALNVINGDVRIEDDLEVVGSKNFIQTHPEDTTKEIVYTAVEGPEAATFIRGKDTLTNGSVTIDLPEHFDLVTAGEGLTAQVTPAGNCNGLYVEQVSDNQLVVKELNNGTSNVAFYYEVKGVREGFEDHQVIRERDFD
ncbi:hypothetical protein L21SP5_01366 [Salinivirga cyanobacteriivorans]|uniref:Uncharacterized protein n=1 Tax=Salinivirga cyanobacteriivorans TaxID=1307839 RepID=A0A0S2HYD1_9BACT|nr:hypothetical protein [Salinivirga cyanobacteriivorans]ALO15016.1 hypothetical protein L21SP5_01366 [Salinivirga cyanobacteriivorans]